MGSSKKVTVGYRYYMGIHFGICHGPVDALHQVSVGGRTAWSGSQTTSGSLAINAVDLFGGDKREGGVEGTLDVMMGEPTQGANSYLVSKLGPIIPAFRRILSGVWRGGQVSSNNPYVKPWAFRVTRILQGWSTGSAWYPEKAEIQNRYTSDPVITRIINVDDDFDYLVVAATNSTDYSSGDFGGLESTGAGPFGNDVHPIDDPEFPAPNTIVARSPLKKIWIKSTFVATAGDKVNFRIKHDNDISIWLNGVALSTTGYATWVSEALNVSAESGTNTVVLRITDAGPDIPGNYIYAGMVADYLAYYALSDMNPAHILYQCLTDTEWGMGYPTASIDPTSFTAAADTLYAEGFGLSMVLKRQETVENLVALVLDHIGAILYVVPATGKFALKLIRADYDRGSLPQYGPENLIAAEDYQRQAWAETINEITVVYTDMDTGKETSVTVQDAANIMTQGGVVAQTRQYPGITQASLAQRVALRDLQATSTPLARIKLTATRAAWEVFPGSLLRLTWPEYDIADVVYRVINVNLGTLTDGRIIIDAVEDVFGLPDNTYLATQASEWEDPSNAPSAAPYWKLLEVPYWDLVRNLSAADMAYVDSLSGYLETLAVRPSNDATNYGIFARTGAANYTARGSGDFCPTATVVSALTKATTAISLTNGVDLDLVEAGGYAVIDDEYVLVSAIDATAGTATISRGLLDTVPAAHAAGARIWFADGWQGFDTTEAADGETVDVKLLPATGQGALAVDLAPADSITFDQRQYRPYPPGNLKFAGSVSPAATYYPSDVYGDLTVSWAHRDRLLQTAYLVEQDEASIGPEADVTYTVEIREGGTLVESASGLTGTSYTASTSGAITLEITLYAMRGGLRSWQSHVHSLNMHSDNSRLMEDGDGRTDEAGETMIQE